MSGDLAWRADRAFVLASFCSGKARRYPDERCQRGRSFEVPRLWAPILAGDRIFGVDPNGCPLSLRRESLTECARGEPIPGLVLFGCDADGRVLATSHRAVVWLDRETLRPIHAVEPGVPMTHVCRCGPHAMAVYPGPQVQPHALLLQWGKAHVAPPVKLPSRRATNPERVLEKHQVPALLENLRSSRRGEVVGAIGKVQAGRRTVEPAVSKFGLGKIDGVERAPPDKPRTVPAEVHAVGHRLRRRRSQVMRPAGTNARTQPKPKIAAYTTNAEVGLRRQGPEPVPTQASNVSASTQ